MAVELAKNMASMGLRPVGRGRDDDISIIFPTADASMGPRPVGRGRDGEGDGQWADILLQWGRGLLAAEGGNGNAGFNYYN